MGRACGTCGDGNLHTGFWLGLPKGKNHLEDLGVDGE
jgi:hypothetical protein